VAGYREFQTGEVLTAANVNGFLMNQAVMVFADDAARTTALSGVLTEGMLSYNLDTKALEVYDGTDWGPVVTAKEKRVVSFTGNGTWTVPAGVTYAIAYMMGGGGGVATQLTGGNGSDSSVAFASGTVIGPGQNRVPGSGPAAGQVVQAGKNGIGANAATGDGQGPSGSSPNTYVVHGAAVTPGASISVVVGAGGSGGTAPSAAGGSGHVYIEYYEEV